MPPCAHKQSRYDYSAIPEGRSCRLVYIGGDERFGPVAESIADDHNGDPWLVPVKMAKTPSSY